MGARIPALVVAMPESRIPDPTLMARLQLSVKGVDWAASLVRGHQHEVPPGHEWSPHQHLVHLLEVETGNYHVRLERMLSEEMPRLEPRVMEARPDLEALDIEELAERFMAARAKTYEVFKGLAPGQWSRAATWPDGTEVDVAWLAEKVLWHALDHFATLLDMHQSFETKQARAWQG